MLNSTPPPRPPRPNSDDPADQLVDPFALHYRPPPPIPGASQRGNSRAPQIQAIPSSSSPLLSVPLPTNRSRPRALSLGAREGRADALGPLPPLPPLPNLASMIVDQALVGQGPSVRLTPPPSHSAPPQTTSFAFSRGCMRRLANEPRNSSDGSPRRPVVRPPAIHFISSDAVPMTETASQPGNTIRIPPAIIPTSISADAVLEPSTSHAMVPRPPTLNATMARPPRIPELDQTWAQFLCETEADLALPESKTVNEIPKPTPSSPPPTSTPPPIPARNKARLIAPQAPPPARPLPAVPQVLPFVAPLNVRRRRGRANTVGSGTTSPREMSPQPLNVSTGVSQGSTRRPFTPPISPPPTAGSQLVFDSLLDVVITPADVTPVHSPERNGHRYVPETPGTSSSLPYLCKSTSSQDLLRSDAASTLRPSSRSSDRWDSSSRTASETSLSMFPAPPTLSPSKLQLQLPIEMASPIRSTSAPPSNRPQSFLPRIPHVASAASISDLETPPITPDDSEFPLLYSLGVASASTSTIRPNSDGKRDTIMQLDEPSEALASPRASTESTSSSYATAMSSELSEDHTTSSAASSHSSSVTSAESIRSSEDSQRSTTPTPMVTITKSTSGRPSRHMLHAMWIHNHSDEGNDSLKVPSLPASGEPNDTFSLLPSFFFEPKSKRPSTPTGPVTLSPRKERLLHLLTAPGAGSLQRSPGSPYQGKVEWGEAL